MNPELEKVLLKVQKPGRYAGGESNRVVKDQEQVDVRFAFCFPDVYEVGMSHLGMKILYGLFNEMDGFGVSACLRPGRIWRNRCGSTRFLFTAWRAETLSQILILSALRSNMS